MKISRCFDSAILKPNMTEDEVKQAIKDCIACRFLHRMRTSLRYRAGSRDV